MGLSKSEVINEFW